MEYVAPAYLEGIPRLRILRCEKDWGPATKFIPVIQEELAAARERTLILVVDDDRVYPRNALELFLHYHNKMPDAALCFRGALIPRNFIWFLPKMFLASQVRETKHVAVITGTAGLLIIQGFFDSEVGDYCIMTLSFFHRYYICYK